MIERFFLHPIHPAHRALFEGIEFPWDVLKRISPFFGKTSSRRILGKVSKGARIEGPIVIGKGTVVETGVYIKGPAWIGANCDIRHGAYLRGFVVMGDRVVIGNSCEIKQSVICSDAHIPHLAYVGDSVLGSRVHLGAGTILSNVTLVPHSIRIAMEGRRFDTGLKKFGAIIGDDVEVGCNCVINPGSLIGAGSLIYPGVSWRGYAPPRSIVKLRQEHVITTRH